MKKQIVFTTCFLLLVLNISAQDADWDKMLRLYSLANSYSMEMTVSIKVDGEQQPVVYKANIKRSGDNYYSAIQGTTTVYGSKYLILVNEKEKTIVYAQTDKSRKNILQDQKRLADSLSKSSQKPVLKSRNGNIKIFSWTSTDGLYTSVDYYVDVTTSYLTKIVYNYRKTEDVAYQQVIVSYASITVNQPVAETWFSEKTYFTIKGKQAIAAGKYTGYKVIEQQTLIPAE